MPRELERVAELFRRIFRLPVFEQESDTRTARFTAAIAAAGTVAPLVAAALAVVGLEAEWTTAAALVLLGGFNGLSLWLVYRKALMTARWVMVVVGIAGTTLLVLSGPTRGFDDIGMMLFPLVVVGASVLLDREGFAVALGLILAALGGILAVELSGALEPRALSTNVGADFGFAVLIVLVSAVASRLLASSLSQSIERARRDGRALAAANRQLEEKAAERERLIAELEARNAELERFTYTVSHDLKTPLVTIGGFLGYLEKHAASGDLDRFRADLGRVDAARTRMARLLDELLELSRVGRLMSPPEDVPFADVVGEARELAAGRLDGRGIEVIVADPLPVVRVDRVRLVEVMQNLLDNAARATLDVPEPRIEIGVRDGAEPPVFYVRDNGIGIEPEYHDPRPGLPAVRDPRPDEGEHRHRPGAGQAHRRGPRRDDLGGVRRTRTRQHLLVHAYRRGTWRRHRDGSVTFEGASVRYRRGEIPRWRTRRWELPIPARKLSDSRRCK